MTSKYLSVLFLFFYVSGNSSQVYKTNSNKDNIIEAVESPSKVETIKNDFITQTVYGFLDFTTTIGNTVMVFSPQSAPPEGKKEKITTGSGIQNKPLTSVEKHVNIQPSKTFKNEQQTTNEKNKSVKNTKIVVNSIVHQKKEETKFSKKIELTTKSPSSSSIVQVRSQEETAVKNNLAEPEYDYLSRQPTEIIDETYRVINLKPSSKILSKPRPSSKKEKENPTGLVTKLGGTIVKDGMTTIHETSVIGTYINGKYAQVLQSTSRIVKSNHGNHLEGKIRPTSSQKILKTIGPQYGKLKPQLEPTPTNQQQQQQEESSLPLEVLFSSSPGNNGKSSRRPSASFAARTKYKNNKISDDSDSNETPYNPQQPRALKKSSSKLSYKNRVLTTTTTTEAPIRRRSGFKPSNSQQSSSTSKSKSEQNFSGLPVPKIKLPRGGSRWAYKATPKPRVNIRKQVDDEEKISTTENIITNESSVSTSTFINDKLVLSSPPAQKKIHDGIIGDDELDPSETEQVSSTSIQNDQPPVTESSAILLAETINVEISTPAEFNDVYFEIATIKSPYSFQVGSVKNTRYITVTSTIKKAFSTADATTSSSAEQLPLTENILANTGVVYESSLPLDSSVATFPAITLESGQSTPPLETITETFTTTQTLLKTYLLPVVANGNTTKHTLVQTYNIARMVTATKTLPPSELYQFIPSKTLNEFNSKLDEAGSELHLELEFSEDDRDDDDIPKRVVALNSESLNSDLDNFKANQKSGNGKLDSSSTSPLPDTNSQLTQEQIQQLALLKYFGQAPGAPQPQVITTSRPVVVLQTIYESHVIPIVNNGNTIYSTLSRAVGTVPKTSYEFGTSTITPPLINPPIPQLPIFPQQPQFTITSAPLVTQTLATVSDSRILKLTFGAKTAYTTLYSTKVVPTEITTYVTTTIPLQQTLPAFPGYFPSPVGYPPYPFVG